MSKYPELDKLKSVTNEKQIIEDFLEWLFDQGIELAKWNEEGNLKTAFHYKELIYSFLGLNEQIIEQERRQLLEEFKNAQEKK